MQKNYQVLDQFWLKLIAILTMTLDHIGVFLCLYAPTFAFNNPMYIVGYIFRCVGRIAMPLFMLFLVEGIRNTSHAGKYLFRIFIVMAIIMGFSAITYYNYSDNIAEAHSPFVDLFLIALTLYLINRKDSLSWLSILPIGYIALVTIVQFIERINNVSLDFLPFYIRPCYSLLGLLIALGFYASYGITNRYLKKTGDFSDEEIEIIKDKPYYRSIVSICMICVLIILNLIVFLLGYIENADGLAYLDIYNHSVENFSLLALPFIFMYTGRRGYNKNWFKYGCYIYFPVHIILIFLIFFISFS